jgi:5-methylcytosine-specific restriction protein A
MSEAKRKYDRFGREPWRKWYKQKAWLSLRQQQLAKQPLCERHLKRGQAVAANVVNHLRPHRGDRLLFLNPANLESVCKACHDGEIQQQEKRGHSSRAGADGWPVDKRHPLYRKF